MSKSVFARRNLRPRARLNTQQVAEIRQRHNAGERQDKIAAIFDITQQQVSNIVRSKQWKDVAHP